MLPAQFPNLLVNGAAGIAVGMATNIPPHNLTEVVRALVQLIDEPETPLEALVGAVIQGPDFPTGGQILSSRADLIEAYRTGSGPIEVEATWREETENRRRLVVIDSIPWGLNKASLVSTIADHIRAGKLPQVVDVRDESTETIRVVLELRRGASAQAAMAYLLKRTPLRTRFNLNLTALVPGTEGEAPRPRRLGLLEVLHYFLSFRREVVERRLRHDLAQLEKRIHILRGFALVFEALDEAIAVIRKSRDRGDAKKRLMKRFALDEVQTNAILEIRLYRLAQMEVEAILAELAEKEEAAAEIRAILGSEARLSGLVRSELCAIEEAYGDARRTLVVGPREEVQFAEEEYIVSEDSVVMVTEGGWIKRQRSYSEVSAVRVREGDRLRWILPADTRERLILFTDRGRAFTIRVDDVPQTTGYGEPLQTRFDFADAERVVGAVTTDPRTLPEPSETSDGAGPAGPFAMAVTRGGRCMRISLDGFREPSTVAGRTFMRLDTKRKGDAVLRVLVPRGDELVSLATLRSYVLVFPVDEVKVLSGPGKGVQAIKLGRGDEVVGWTLVQGRMEGLEITTNRGRTETVRPNKFGVGKRAARGRQLMRTGTVTVAPYPTEELRFSDTPAEPPAERAPEEDSPPTEVEAEHDPEQGDLF